VLLCSTWSLNQQWSAALPLLRWHGGGQPRLIIGIYSSFGADSATLKTLFIPSFQAIVQRLESESAAERSAALAEVARRGAATTSTHEAALKVSIFHKIRNDDARLDYDNLGIGFRVPTFWLSPYTLWGHQVIQLINEVPGDLTPPIDTYGQPNHIQPATMTAIVKALVAREYDRDWAPTRDLAMCVRLAHTNGT
jgi:hypothetical protein